MFVTVDVNELPPTIVKVSVSRFILSVPVFPAIANTVGRPVSNDPSPWKEPLKEPDNIEVAPVEVIILAPIANVVPESVSPLFSISPAVPAISILLSVKVEEVIAAKCADDPLTIIFFQFAMLQCEFYIL